VLRVTDDAARRLVLDQLARGARSVTVRMWGSSMRPVVWPGALVRLEPVEARAIRRGDVVWVDLGGDRVALHRVVSRTSDRVVTRGDACPRCDPAVPIDRVRARLAGVVIGRWAWHGAPAPLGRLVDRAALALAPSMRVGLGAARRTWRTLRDAPAISRLRRRHLGHVRIEVLEPAQLDPLRLYLRRRGGELTEERLDAWNRAASGATAGDCFAVVAVARVGIVGAALVQASAPLVSDVLTRYQGLGIDRALASAARDERRMRASITIARSPARSA